MTIGKEDRDPVGAANPSPAGDSVPASPIEFRLDPASGVPTYLQLVHQVKQAVRLGIIGPGDQLPTVKEVVSRLAINPNTVLKAYRELEHAGLVAPRPGVGTFVTKTLSDASLAAPSSQWVLFPTPGREL